MKDMFLKKSDIYYSKWATVVQKFQLSMTKLGNHDEIRWFDGTWIDRVRSYLGLGELEVLVKYSGQINHHCAGHSWVHCTQEPSWVGQGVIVTGYHHPTGGKGNLIWVTISAPRHSWVHIHNTQEPSWAGQKVIPSYKRRSELDMVNYHWAKAHLSPLHPGTQLGWPGDITNVEININDLYLQVIVTGSSYRRQRKIGTQLD
jgi:hypothetical protein